MACVHCKTLLVVAAAALIGAGASFAHGREEGAETDRPTPLAPTGDEAFPAGVAERAQSEQRPLIPGRVTPGGPAAGATVIDTPGMFTGLGGIAAPLAIVVGAILIAAALLRKAAGKSSTLAAALSGGAGSPSGVLEVLGRFPVARGQSLILLKVDQRVLLLAQAHGHWRGRGASPGFSTLCEITDPSEVASILLKTRDDQGESAARTFGSLMQRFAGEGRTLADDEPEIGRQTRRTAQGDRVELWDDRALVAPLADAAGPTGPAGQARSARSSEARVDAVAALRQRLALMGNGDDARTNAEGSA